MVVRGWSLVMGTEKDCGQYKAERVGLLWNGLKADPAQPAGSSAVIRDKLNA